jgi:hypothetical protein
VEAAVYPRDGAAPKIDFFDFTLKPSAGELIHPARPEEVARMWPEKDGQLPGHRVEVISEVGVVYTSGAGPNQRRGNKSGWSGV